MFRTIVSALFAGALLLALPSASPLAANTPGKALTSGKILFNGRLRYESVDQDGFSENANAFTFRARFGYETAPYRNFVLLAEGDITRALGVDDFNSTVNGKTGFPVVADPNSLRLNRLNVSFTGIEDTTVKAGRQRIILDDARFVGNVGFRQNEQTFDAARVTTKAVAGVVFDYIYLWQVNRIFGSRSPAGESGADTHLVHVSYGKFPLGTLTGYAYLIDLDALAALSNQTYGIRLAGEQPLGKDASALYTAGYAHQSDYGNNPARFGLDFIELEAGFSYYGALIKAGFQKLEGNGARGFQTPLATLHAFQGFADLFLTTPTSGIEDLYLILGYKTDQVAPLGELSLTLWLHDFAPDVAGPDLGEEVDFEIAASPAIQGRKVRFSLKFAAFSGSPVLPDVTKVWLAMDLAF